MIFEIYGIMRCRFRECEINRLSLTTILVLPSGQQGRVRTFSAGRRPAVMKILSSGQNHRLDSKKSPIGLQYG
ncbi:MAG: hypothetical protein LBH82_04800 [Bacteroidales bacterium]|jgi:hypothetical protein|nr:hypothetical protein [Bacteroidales bacterium]